MPCLRYVKMKTFLNEDLLSINLIPNIHESELRSVYLNESLKTAEAITAGFPKCKAVANTFRFDITNDIKYYTTLYTGNQLYQSHEYETGAVVDKVGSGDCFMAGLIYGFYNNAMPQETLNFATAAAFEKLFVKGDAIDKTAGEIKKAIK
jgi:2-dehydro-3-deoxygluconokinase